MSRESRLTELLLSLFSADELRRVLRYNFPEALTQGLPGANASALALADATSQALVQRGELDGLWSLLFAERPRRRAEIEAVREVCMQATARAPAPSEAGPIRVLFVLSCPPSQVQIDAAEEIRQIRAELRSAPHRDRFTHTVVTAATYADLRKALREHKPHILHIACHCTPEAELVLSDGHGDEQRVPAASFVGLLGLLKDNLRLVILNACHSTAIARQLVPMIDLVVGMRGAVSDRGAIAFAAVFYESIAAGDTVETSFELGVNELSHRAAQSCTPELLPLVGPQRQRRFGSP